MITKFVNDNLLSVIKGCMAGCPTGLDYRITIIVDPPINGNSTFKMVAKAERLPIQKSGAQVEIMKSSRSCPDIKVTSWVMERQAVEEAKLPDSDEVLIVDDDEIPEGLSSNFALILMINGEMCLLTAPRERVLEGTIMELVKSVVSQMDTITLIEKCPTISDLITCSAAFITSTSRLILPIDTILSTNHETISLTSSTNKILEEISSNVIKLLISRSIPL